MKHLGVSFSFKLSVCVLIFLGSAVTAWGLVHMAWPRAVTFTRSGIWQFFLYIFACGFILTISYYLKSQRPLKIAFIIGVGVTAIAGALWALIITFFFVISSTVLGSIIISKLSGDSNAQNGIDCFLVGAGLYGTVVGLLAQFPVNYSGVYAAMVALPLVIWRRRLLAIIEAIRDWLCHYFSMKNVNGGWVEIGIAIAVLIYVVVALMPEVGFDALATHLFVPSQIAIRHKWGFDVSTYVWAVMPFLGDCIYTICYTLADETAVRLVNVVFIAALCWIIRELIIWAGGSRAGAKWAVLIFLFTPLTFTEGSTLYIEAIWTAFLVGGTMAVLRICSLTDIKKKDIVIAGILLGSALSTKLVTGTVLPALLLILLYHFRTVIKKELYRVLIISLFLFFFFGIIPYARAYFITGNPVFPFYNQIFKSSFYPLDNFNNPRYNSGISWDLFFRIAFDSGNYLESTPGASGFQWLILLLPAIALLLNNRRWKGLLIFLIAMTSITITFMAQSYLRYIFPAFALLTAVLGVFMSDIALWAIWGRRFIYAITCITVGLNIIFLNAGAFYRDFPLNSLGSETNRSKYLEDRLPIRNAVKLVNDLINSETPVAVFAQPMTAGLATDALYANWYNYEFQEVIQKARTEADIADALIVRNVYFIVLDEYWGDADKRLLIENATEKIKKIGTIQVRRLKKNILFNTEMLDNYNFETVKGWISSDGAKLKPGVGALVNVESNIFQAVAVKPGRRYLNSVVVRCDQKETQGRVQINWMDAKSRILKTDIQLFVCSDCPTKHSMEVVCPPKATTAVVYCSGHNSTPLLFVSNSLRK